MVEIKGERSQDSYGAVQRQGRWVRGGVFKAFPKERNRDKIQSGKNGNEIKLMYFLGVIPAF